MKSKQCLFISKGILNGYQKVVVKSSGFLSPYTGNPIEIMQA